MKRVYKIFYIGKIIKGMIQDSYYFKKDKSINLINYDYDHSDFCKTWYLLRTDSYTFFDRIYHRSDGPAIEYCNGDTEYWINGKHIPELNNKKIYGKENLTKYLSLV